MPCVETMFGYQKLDFSEAHVVVVDLLYSKILVITIIPNRNHNTVQIECHL